MDETSGIALALKTGVPSYEVEDREGRIHLLINLPIEEQNEDSGGPIRQALIPDPFLKARWSRSRKGVLALAGIRMRNLYYPGCAESLPKSLIWTAFLAFVFRQIFCHVRDQTSRFRVRHDHSAKALMTFRSPRYTALYRV